MPPTQPHERTWGLTHKGSHGEMWFLAAAGSHPEANNGPPQGRDGEAGSDRQAKQVEERQARVAGGGRPFLSFSPWLLSVS